MGGYHNAESVRFFGDMVFVSFCLQTVSVESVVSMGYDRGIIGAAYPVEIADAVGNYINRCDFKRGDYTDAVSIVFCTDTEHVSGGKKDLLCRVFSVCCVRYDACQRADDADAAFVDAVYCDRIVPEYIRSVEEMCRSDACDLGDTQCIWCPVATDRTIQ